jgi:hypothetical protein
MSSFFKLNDMWTFFIEKECDFKRYRVHFSVLWKIISFMNCDYNEKTGFVEKIFILD